MSAEQELHEDTSQTNTTEEQTNSDSFPDRGVPYRSTVARKCREFYLKRLERTETLQRRWSVSTTTLLSEMKEDNVDNSASPEVEDSSGVESEGSTCSGDGHFEGGQSQQSRRRSEPVNKLLVTTDLSANIKENNINNDDKKVTNDEDEKSDNCELNHCGKDENVKSAGNTNQTGSDLPPLRKWNSTLDLAMHNLRQEITSLIAQDNDLFRQLLSLNDSIVELREQQKRNLELSQLEDEEDDEDDEFDGGSRSPSLESLSDPDTSATTPSPASTLSSSCSSHYSRNNNVKNNGHHHVNGSSRRPALPSSMRSSNPGSCHQYHRHHSSHDGGRPRSSSSNLCLRCHSTSSGKMVAMPLLRRRAHSQVTLHWKRDDFDSYDSGIHLQGSHSDSDHEIFV